MYENDASLESRNGFETSGERDWRAIVRALDEIYDGASNVGGLVEDGKLERAEILECGLERWLVASSLTRAGDAAEALADVAAELPAELMLDDLMGARDLLRAPDGHVDWEKVADVALSVLPKVHAFSRRLFWERWIPILGEGAPRLPFAMHD